MPVMISMLRSLNLGKHNRVKMDALRAVYEALGMRDVETYVQSGNVVFRAPARGIGGLAQRIEEALERECGVRTTAVQRTADEMRQVIARNPFAGRSGMEAARFGVHFLARDPGAEARGKVLAMPPCPEELRVEDRELYIYYTNGMARPKLSMAAVERALGTVGTSRNWNTVTNLLAMAERLESKKS